MSPEDRTVGLAATVDVDNLLGPQMPRFILTAFCCASSNDLNSASRVERPLRAQPDSIIWRLIEIPFSAYTITPYSRFSTVIFVRAIIDWSADCASAAPSGLPESLVGAFTPHSLWTPSPTRLTV